MHSHIHVQVDGNPVPPVPRSQILGLWVQQDTHNHDVISWLQATARQLNNLLRRLSRRRHGVKEKEAHHMVQTFLFSRIAYMCPYLRLGKADLDKINSLKRTAYKAIGLPKWTNSDRLLSLGIHNTAEEIFDKCLDMVRLSEIAVG